MDYIHEEYLKISEEGLSIHVGSNEWFDWDCCGCCDTCDAIMRFLLDGCDACDTCKSLAICDL
jgi:hypothetical protein